ncbi:MAG: hypothetical protein H0A76_08410 [Candidatus Thiodubiliella endoseptemdiera]|uniref:Uncharacterized protein n=1 Tax=Candidatus Thiodubiliella endoseptemdiera TaxID=2738886 RepID=A0A853F2M2_9GAMM|nr:hypothetical protein [Candidatus Thiodubiliella endoseptemdiera]
MRVTNAFEIKDLTKVAVKGIDYKVSDIDNDFQDFLKINKVFILVYRMEGMTGRHNVEAKKLNTLKIELCQKVSCEIEGEIYNLSNYDYLIDNKSI